MTDRIVCGWFLVFAGILLLSFSGRLELLSLLFPLSLMLAGLLIYGCDKRTGLRRSTNKE